MQESPTLEEAAAVSCKCHGSTLGTREAILEMRIKKAAEAATQNSWGLSEAQGSGDEQERTL